MSDSNTTLSSPISIFFNGCRAHISIISLALVHIFQLFHLHHDSILHAPIVGSVGLLQIFHTISLRMHIFQNYFIAYDHIISLEGWYYCCNFADPHSWRRTYPELRSLFPIVINETLFVYAVCAATMVAVYAATVVVNAVCAATYSCTCGITPLTLYSC